MSNIDDLIEQVLKEEDQDLINRYGSEPGYLKQASGLFLGPLGWVMWVAMSAQLVCFAAAIWAVWQLFTDTDVLAVVRSGALAVIAVQIGTFLRGFMGDHFEANRVLREIKRLELRLVRMQEND